MVGSNRGGHGGKGKQAAGGLAFPAPPPLVSGAGGWWAGGPPVSGDRPPPSTPSECRLLTMEKTPSSPGQHPASTDKKRTKLRAGVATVPGQLSWFPTPSSSHHFYHLQQQISAKDLGPGSPPDSCIEMGEAERARGCIHCKEGSAPWRLPITLCTQRESRRNP